MLRPRPAEMLKRVRGLDSAVRSVMLSATDRGVLNRTPLDTHVVICGFPRSGSSLLQVMVGSCVADVRTFIGESRAMTAARRAQRNHRFLLTKRPGDIHEVGHIRSHYARRSAQALLILMVRDPRDVLTSRAPRGDGYAYPDPRAWQRTYEAVRTEVGAADSVVVRYEDLVSDPEQCSDSLAARIGWDVVHPFANYQHSPAHAGLAVGDFLDQAMGGARPPDDSRIRRWADPTNQERLDLCHQLIPGLAAAIDDLGY